MPVPTRLVKRRIKSIRSTRKIMKAMELVAASKMRKAIGQTLASRPYAALIEEMSRELRTLVYSHRHPLLTGFGLDRAKKTLLVVVASDRGLCGGFNAQIVKQAVEFLKLRTEDVELVTIGRRAEQVVRRSHRVASASFESIANVSSFARVKPMADYLLQAFLDQRVGKIFIAYTEFQSTLVQVPHVNQLLPVIPEIELVVQPTYIEREALQGERILFEPSPDAVFEGLLPALIEMQIYQALLESSASEHSARMLAMKNAGDAAKDMLEDLTFALNQARQAGITQEISEISAGKAAIQ